MAPRAAIIPFFRSPAPALKAPIKPLPKSLPPDFKILKRPFPNKETAPPMIFLTPPVIKPIKPTAAHFTIDHSLPKRDLPFLSETSSPFWSLFMASFCSFSFFLFSKISATEFSTSPSPSISPSLFLPGSRSSKSL